MRFWLLLHNLRAKIPMKLNAPDDLLSKRQDFFLSSLDNAITVKTLNIGTPRAATVVVLNIKQFNFTMT